ncbi:MAG: hypothetical protein ACOYOP_08810 [Microthrixaceae bacterium]
MALMTACWTFGSLDRGLGGFDAWQRGFAQLPLWITGIMDAKGPLVVVGTIAVAVLMIWRRHTSSAAVVVVTLAVVLVVANQSAVQTQELIAVVGSPLVVLNLVVLGGIITVQGRQGVRRVGLHLGAAALSGAVAVMALWALLPPEGLG